MSQWTLKLDSPLVTPDAPNARLPSWPPPDDFPISLDADGNTLSVFSDSKWILTPYAGRTCTLSFGDRGGIRQYPASKENARLHRLCALWFLFGKRRRIKTRSIASYQSVLKVIFSVCSRADVGILASELCRYDKVVEDALAPAVNPGDKHTLVIVLNSLWHARDALGFTLLTPKQITKLIALVPEHPKKQHLMLPPRIWLYQTERLRSFLNDFLAHRKELEDLFATALHAYLHNFGGAAAFDSDTPSTHYYPFGTSKGPGLIALGHFPEVAQRHGVADLLKRWTLPPGTDWENEDSHHSVTRLAVYFNQVNWVGTHHLINWSGMRSGEALSLRSDCFLAEQDPHLGLLYSLRGETTKTVEDDDARWVTADEAELAVTAMSAVSRMRLQAAAKNPGVLLAVDDQKNPYLVTRAYEPWACGGTSEDADPLPPATRPNIQRYAQWQSACPNLFAADSLRIQPEDFRIARHLEPTLDPDEFGIGMEWSLMRHQLRRTFIGGMAAAGVSVVSQQMQSKHLTQQQVVYYNTGYSAMNYNQKLANELVIERYRAASRLAEDLSQPHWVSPHGPKEKQKLIDRFYHTSSTDEISRDIREGSVAVRLTLFGVCTRRDTCPYGGWQNYVHCSDCTDALFDTRKHPTLRDVGRTIALRLADAPKQSPLHDLLERKAKAIDEVLSVST